MRHHELALDLFVVPAGLVVAYFVLDMGTAWGVLIGAALVVASVPLVVRRVMRVRTSDQPVIEALKAMMLFVSVWVIGFSTFYYGLQVRSQDQFNGLETKLDAVYFTVTMMSTVGFGDITATGQFARGVATVNMLLNLVALGVVVKGLTWAARQRFDETGGRLRGIDRPRRNAP